MEEINRNSEILQQAQKREVELQENLDSKRKEYNHALQEMEAKFAATLRAANNESAAKMQRLEEGYQWVLCIKNEELLNLQCEHTEMPRDFVLQHKFLCEIETEKNCQSKRAEVFDKPAQPDSNRKWEKV